MFNNEYLRCFSSRMSGNLTHRYSYDCFDGGEGVEEAGERFSIAGEGFNGGKRSYSDSLEARALAASRNHSEAERRRRERINTHLSTLRRLIPSRDKMDKATLLGEVIHHVKELKKRFAEVANGDSIPTDFDDLKVESHGGDENGRNFIRISICCDERPDLLADLLQSFNDQRLKTVKAEMSCLGGRVRNVFLVTSQEEVNGSNEETECFNSVKEALREVLNRSASSELTLRSSVSNKRHRILSFDSSSSLLLELQCDEQRPSFWVATPLNRQCSTYEFDNFTYTLPVQNNMVSFTP